MRFLLEAEDATSFDDVVRAADAVHELGLDGLLLSPTDPLPAPLVTAAALAARVREIRIAVEVPLGDRHPVELAEEAAVTDVATGGRLILVVRPAEGREAAFGEAVDLLRLSFAAVPFRFDGAHWTVPAGLPQNVHNTERLIRVTPPPAQPRLELWTAGAGREAGLARGLGHVAAAGDDPDELGRAFASAATPASLGAPRGRHEHWTDAASLVGRLHGGRAAFGQDWAVVTAPIAAAGELSWVVRPRVQLDRLPPGLVEFWDADRPWLLSEGT